MMAQMTKMTLTGPLTWPVAAEEIARAKMDCDCNRENEMSCLSLDTTLSSNCTITILLCRKKVKGQNLKIRRLDCLPKPLDFVVDLCYARGTRFNSPGCGLTIPSPFGLGASRSATREVRCGGASSSDACFPARAACPSHAPADPVTARVLITRQSSPSLR